MGERVDLEKKKRDMMELWKDTFHDSSRYIQLVFDAYFNPDNAFTVYEGDKLIAALLGVEYEFMSNDGVGCSVYRGLYLCGLATHPDYRRQGIMGKLMEEAERSAKARGFAMTFLIPADSHLREYYHRKGYRTTSFKRNQTAKREKKEGQTKMYIYTFKEFFERKNLEFISKVAQWCCDREKPEPHSATILHSKKDMIAIMAENENSFFITDQSFDPEYPILAKIRAVVFPTAPNEKNDTWGIVGIFLKEKEECISSDAPMVSLPDEIADVIQETYPDMFLEFKLPYTGRELRIGVEAIPYAMTKTLEENENIIECENPSYEIYLMLD
ncbi:MAG: GNAT family N-acetyltransferase [Muribaculaceae bacterium]|nr:GNAT family N-acetyltransferase [Muribaculaceae bacterium]